MISRWRESQIVRSAVEAVPFGRGETSDQRVERVAQYIGASRSGLYNMMSEEKDARIGLNQMLRLLDLVDEQTRRRLWADCSTPIGLRVEQIGNGKAQP